MDFNKHEVHFTTFTIERWIPVFEDYPECIGIIYKSFEYLSQNKEVKIYGFVIMIDHVHILWEFLNKYEVNSVISRFKKFTGNEIKKYLQSNEKLYLSNFISDRKDRLYKIWKLKSSSTRITHPNIYYQKLNYIHQNPAQGNYKVVEKAEEYEYSSALSYINGKSLLPFLTILKIK